MNNSGNMPVMMRITYQKQRISFATNVFIAINHWDHSKQRVKGSAKQVSEYNKILDSLRSKAWHEFAEAKRKGISIEPKKIKEIITGASQPTISLLHAIKEHIGFLKTRIGIDICINTVKKYETLEKKVTIFLKAFDLGDPPLHALKRQFIIDFETHMRNHNPDTADFFRMTKAPHLQLRYLMWRLPF
ncbi:MAG TPA: Arm DNA-binding domain-containing protein [Flavitalea sp.]|nr:Arm DNA-binding domain-containing protein [Flavitalea sp.]